MNLKSKLLAIGGAIGLMANAPARAGQGFTYDVFAAGKHIGSIAITSRKVVHDGAAAEEIAARTKLHAKILLVTVFSLDSDETMVVGAAGLLRYDSRSELDNHQIVAHGAREEGFFTIDLEVDGEPQTRRIALANLDFSSAEGPDLDALEPGVAKPFRVLDLDRLEVVERRFTRLRDETLTVGGLGVACRVVDVSDAFGRSRRWVAKDTSATLIQEEGTDEDGAFRIVLTRYWPPRP